LQPLETPQKVADDDSGPTMRTRSGGPPNDALQVGSQAQVKSAANVCWVLRCGMSKWSYHFAGRYVN